MILLWLNLTTRKRPYSRGESPTVANILIVDDDVKVALTIERVLRTEYGVRVAYSGSEALKIVRRDSFDLIILDIMMPGPDGVEVCRELRQDPLMRSIPILFLTARSRIEDRIVGLEAGADDYITKPFDIRELLLRVRAILRRAYPEEEQQQDSVDKLEVGALTLDCQSYQMIIDGEAVLLTPVEFNLAYHLMSHPGEVFSSEQLLRALWDYPSDTGSPDLVRMHIKNLRRKIEPDPQNPRFLITIPRHGYTMTDQQT
jgi:DNA-binding response OmpR family regulator